MYLIYRHLLRNCVGPFFFGLFVITFLLMIDVLYRYVDLFVTKGVAFSVATKFLGLSLGHTFALSVPMTVLIAVLMGVGQLASDHEITAMKASGIGLYSVLRPLLLGGLMVGLALAAYNHFVFPEMNHKLANLIYDIRRMRPMMEIRPQMFTRLNDRMTIFVRTKDDLTNEITGVSIFEKAGPDDLGPRLTTAETGRIVPLHETDSLLIELFDGETHEYPDPEQPHKYQVIRFEQHDTYLRNAEEDFEESNRTTRRDREMNVSALLEAARAEIAQNDEVARRTAELTARLIDYQWQLLDAEERPPLIGRKNGFAGERAPAFRVAKTTATRQKVEQARTQTAYQEKVRHSHRTAANKYLVEVHKKFAIPFACVVFVVLGVPMAVTTARAGRGVSVSLALGAYTIYYLFLVGGEKLVDRGFINNPFWAMWAANFILLGIGVPLFVRTVRESTLFHFTLKPVADVEPTPPRQVP